jgi:hypothetical protein
VAQEETAETESTVESSPSDVERVRSYSSQSSHPSLDEPVRDVLREVLECSESAVLGQAGASSRRLQFCPNEPLVFDEVEFGACVDQGPLTQTPASMYTHPSISWFSCLTTPCRGADTCDVDHSVHARHEDEGNHQHVHMSLDYPLGMESGSMAKNPLHADDPFPLLALGSQPGEASLQWAEIPYFHVARSCTSPPHSLASRRSLSVPKDSGCKSCAYEAAEDYMFAGGNSLSTPSVYGDYAMPSSSVFSACPMEAYPSMPYEDVAVVSQEGSAVFSWPTLADDQTSIIHLDSLLR